jgi:tetratricopeptide (TPR) repeat protein
VCSIVTSIVSAITKFLVRIGWVFSRLIKVWILPLIALLLVWACVLELRSHTVEIQTFEVSTEMTAAGYTGNTVQKLFSRQLEKIQEGAVSFRFAEGSRVIQVPAESDLDIKVPQTEISLRSLIRYVRDLVGIPVIKISGSCVTKNGTLIVSIWTTGRDTFTKTYTWPTYDQVGPLENALLDSAENVFLRLEPFTAATFDYNSDRPRDALVAIGRCLRNKNPEDDHQAYALWGRILADSGKYAMAIEKCDESLRLKPGYVYAKLHKANALDDWGKEDQSKEDQALQLYGEIISSNPNETSGYIDRGLCLNSINRRAEAVRDFEKALELDPNSMTAKKQLVLFKADSGEMTTAIQMAIELAQLYPTSYEWCQLAGDVLVKDQQYLEAVDWFSKAMASAKSADRKFQSLFKRASCYGQAGDAIKAIDGYRAALKLDNRDPASWINLGIELKKRVGASPEVFECYNKALEIIRGHDGALLNRGLAYEEIERWSDAKADFEAIIANASSRESRRERAKVELETLRGRLAAQEADRQISKLERRSRR